MDEMVLVTGGTGFLGTHCIAALLRAGYQVRTTVRSLAKAPELRDALERAGVDPAGLAFAAANLNSDEGWREAVTGCDLVMHVASPFPMTAPAHEDELIRPAVGGVERVLGAAVEAGVRRVVLTSSVAAVMYGVPTRPEPFTEADWSNVDGDISAYAKSKTLAERRAWELVDGKATELAVVNPSIILGPTIGRHGTSIGLVQALLAGSYPALPRSSFGVVDARDVATLHLLALTRPEAAGQRFLATAEPTVWLVDIARILREGLGRRAAKVPRRVAPDWLIRVAALWDPAIRQILPGLGTKPALSSAKAREVLGWNPRSVEEAVLAAGESLLATSAA